MSTELTQLELDALSAFLDGELTDEQVAVVQNHIDRDSAWREAYEQFMALDAVLDQWSTPAADPQLPAKIATAVRQAPKPRPLVFRMVVGVGSLAAAAAMLLAVLWLAGALGHSDPGQIVRPDDANPVVREVLAGIPAADHVAVENLDFFQDYDVVANMETLQAIEILQQSESGT